MEIHFLYTQLQHKKSFAESAYFRSDSKIGVVKHVETMTMAKERAKETPSSLVRDGLVRYFHYDSFKSDLQEAAVDAVYKS